MDYRLLIIPVMLVIIAVIELDNHNFLRRTFAEEDLKGYHSMFYPLLILAAVSAFLIIFPFFQE